MTMRQALRGLPLCVRAIGRRRQEVGLAVEKACYLDEEVFREEASGVRAATES